MLSGVDAEVAEPAFPVATGKVADSPPEHSSGTGTPSPTKGPVPTVPMRYRAQRKLRKGDVSICGWNIAVVVFLLLAVWFEIIVLLVPHGIACLFYLITMHTALREIRHHLKAPELRDQGELTSYVTKMQRAQPQVSFTVVCSHTAGSRTKTSRTGTSRTEVTHRSSHPFMYATSTDASTLTKNWQQPASGGGEENGSVGTGFVAVVSSGLSWSAAKGMTAAKLKAEKERLHAENKHRDKDCSVTVKVSLPDQLPHQLYVPTGMKSRQLPAVVELLLVFFGLGAPLYFYYTRSRLSRHIEHKVHKTIYIEGHSASAV